MRHLITFGSGPLDPDQATMDLIRTDWNFATMVTRNLFLSCHSSNNIQNTYIPWIKYTGNFKLFKFRILFVWRLISWMPLLGGRVYLRSKFWKRFCVLIVEREEEVGLWSGEGGGMTAYSNATAHYSSVDTVHVMREVVASGKHGLCCTRYFFTNLTPK